MQVSNVQDHVTHAVIGGKPTIEFGISNSAEFFHILSSTLYSNQILAVVREVICNAWDAHIAAGKKDIPVEVEITDSMFRVRDFGHGIPHDAIGPIYGTYGSSTKTNDGKQTGGFGLGCKAPFAYIDHFEVTSTNAGTRTIYTMSKSSAQANGKPGITPITSFPSQDTGLQVSLGIKTASDVQKFKAYLAQTVYLGDMKVMLNGTLLKTLNMQGDFAFVRRDEVPGGGLESGYLYVRYGNVTYPITNESLWGREFAKIESFAERFCSYGVPKPILILQAPPHSIAVTPSRERLSMQDKTLETVHRLMKGFIDTAEEQIFGKYLNHIHKMTDEAVVRKDIGALLSSHECSPRQTDTPPPVLRSPAECVVALTNKYYPKSGEFRKKDLSYRIQAMAKAKLLDAGLASTFVKAMAHTPMSTLAECTSMYSWGMKRVLHPLIRSLDSDPSGLLNSKGLMIYRALNYRSASPLCLATEWYDSSLNQALSLLRKVVVVTSSQAGLGDRINRCPELNGAHKPRQILVYHIGQKRSATDPAIAVFKKRGYEVLDFTKHHDWDTPKKEREPSASRSKLTSWVQLQEARRDPITLDLHYPHNAGGVDAYGVKTISAPEYFHLIKTGDSDTRLFGLSLNATSTLIKLFGLQGCIVKYKYELAPLEAKKVPEFKSWVIAKVLDYVKNSQTIQDHFSKSLNRLEQPSSRIWTMIVNTPELRSHFGVADQLAGLDKTYSDLWMEMSKSPTFAHLPEVAALKAIEEATPIYKPHLDIIDKVNECHNLEYLNTYEMSKDIDQTYDVAKKANAMKFLINTLDY